MYEGELGHRSSDGLVSSTPDAICYADPETGTILDVEGGFEALFGYAASELIGQDQTILHPPAETAEYRALFEHHLESVPAVISQFSDGSPVYIRTADGEQVPVEINAWPTEKDGKPVIQAVFRDISVPIRRDRRLSQFREAVESAVNPVAAIDCSFEYLFANPAYAEPLGYDPTDIVGQRLDSVLGTERFEEVKPHLECGFAGEVCQFELTREFPDGAVRDFEATYSPLRSEDGAVYGLIGSFNDVTERIRREQELERLFDGMEDAAFLHNPDGKFLVVNETAVERYGYSEAEFASMSPMELDTEEEAALVEERTEEIRRDGSFVFETVHRSKSGEEIPVEISSSIIQYKGQPAVLSIARDITKRRESERKFQVLFNNASDAMVHTEYREGDPYIQAVNPAFADLFDVEPETLVGRPLVSVFDSATTSYEMGEIDRRIRNDEFMRMEIQRRTPEGTRDFLLRSVPIDPAAGEYYRVYTDITERKERERTLIRQRDELKTLNRLNELVLAIIQELVAADSRSDIESVVCRELAASPLFEFAWIGDQDPESGHVRMRTCSGSESDFASVTGFEPEGESWEIGPADQSFQTGEIQVVQNTSVDPRFTDTARMVGDREVRSVAAVPLAHRGSVYATMVIYAPREYAFTGREVAGLETLGKIVEFAINAVRNRKLLTTDTVVELEFDVSDSSFPLVALSRDLGCQIELDGFVRGGSEGRTTIFLRVDGIPPEQFLDAVERATIAERVEQVTAENDDGYRVELTMQSGLLSELDERHKASLQTVDLDGRGGRVVFDVPLTEDVREIVDLVTAEYPDVSFSAKREREDSVESPFGTGGTLETELTDRQFEVLKTALLAGYFEWPRDSTAGDVADAVGITSSTFQYHLRHAQQVIFRRLLGEDG